MIQCSYLHLHEKITQKEKENRLFVHARTFVAPAVFLEFLNTLIINNNLIKIINVAYMHVLTLQQGRMQELESEGGANCSQDIWGLLLF